MVIAAYNPEPGQTRDQAEEVALDAESLISEREGVNTYQFSLGDDGMMGMGSMMGISDNSALFFIEYDDDFEDFADESLALIEELDDSTTQGEWSNLDFGDMGGGLELNVYGDNIEDIQTAVDDLLPVLEDNKDLDQVESDITEAYDQYTLVANQDKLSEHGLTAAQIGMALSDSSDNDVLTIVENDDVD